MKGQRWSLGQINALLNHLEDNKGDHGMYVVNFPAAVSAASLLVSEYCPSQPKSTVQVTHQLTNLWSKHRGLDHRGKKTSFRGPLLREGRSALDPAYSEKNLSQLEKNGARRVVHTAQQCGRARRRQSTVTTEENLVSRSRNIPSDENPGPSSQTAMRRSESVDQRYRLPSYDIEPNSQSLVPLPKRPRQNRQDQESLFARSSLRIAQDDESFKTLEATLIPPRVRSFLRKDSDEFLPTQATLDDLKVKVIRRIRAATLAFFESSDTSEGEIPQLHASRFLSMPFLQLCERIYHSGTENLLRKISLIQRQSSLSLINFYRAIMAAAITEWIFEGEHSPLPTDLFEKAKSALMFERMLADVHFKLYELIRRQRDKAYIEKETDFESYVPSLTDRFFQAVTSFNKHNVHKPNQESNRKWWADLSEIFKLALELSAQVSLLGQEFVFQLPRCGDRYDRNTMISEPENSKNEGIVHVALFPALVKIHNHELDADEDTSDPVIFPALVILQ